MKKLLIFLCLAPFLSFGQGIRQQSKTPASGSSAGNQYYLYYGLGSDGYFLLPTSSSLVVNNAADYDGSIRFSTADTSIYVRFHNNWYKQRGAGGGGGSTPTGPAGGDLSGLYPNPIVINYSGNGITVNRTTAGNIVTLKYTGTTVSSIDQTGAIFAPSISNLANPSSANVTLSSLGTLIRRAVVDNQATLLVQNQLQGATGGIARFADNVGDSFIIGGTNWGINPNTVYMPAYNTTNSGIGRQMFIGGQIVPNANNDREITLDLNTAMGSSKIATVGSIVGGSGYPNGSQLAFASGGTGQGAVFNITVSGGVIQPGATVYRPGVGYTVGDVLTLNCYVGGVLTGSGGTATVTANTTYTGINPLSLRANAPVQFNSMFTGNSSDSLTVTRNGVQGRIAQSSVTPVGTNGLSTSGSNILLGGSTVTSNAIVGLNNSFVNSNIYFRNLSASLPTVNQVQINGFAFSSEHSDSKRNFSLLTENGGTTVGMSVGALAKIASQNISFTLDTLIGASLIDGHFRKGITYQFNNDYHALSDSSLVPKHYVDSLFVTGSGTTAHPLTMNNGGAGDASGTIFNGALSRTISYNTIGAGGLAANQTWSGNNSYTFGVNVAENTAVSWGTFPNFLNLQLSSVGLPLSGSYTVRIPVVASGTLATIDNAQTFTALQTHNLGTSSTSAATGVVAINAVNSNLATLGVQQYGYIIGSQGQVYNNIAGASQPMFMGWQMRGVQGNPVQGVYDLVQSTNSGTLTATGISAGSTGSLGVGTLNVSLSATTINGATSGSMACSEPFRGAGYKKVMVFSSALNGSGVSSYTFPTAFTNTPVAIFTAAGLTVTTLNTTTLAVTGTGTSGWIIIEGY